MKLSIIIPVYYNEESLTPLYNDLKDKVLSQINYDYEIIMVNDGSQDQSYAVMENLVSIDPNIKIFSLSRNFGSHAAVLCGLSKCTGDCAVIKAADLQEPSELIIDMVESWKKGNNVVLAVRKARQENMFKNFFANLYYYLVRKLALPSMPKHGFDIFLIDKKVVQVLLALDERNSSITAQILWSGFKTAEVPYVRLERTIGKSKWTLRKKMRLVGDTLFSFSNSPIKFIFGLGCCSSILSIVLGIIMLILRIAGIPTQIYRAGYMIFSLFLFGLTMLSLGIIGEYLWRTLDAARNRPPYIIEEEHSEKKETKHEI